jgi:hypothetical protein
MHSSCVFRALDASSPRKCDQCSSALRLPSILRRRDCGTVLFCVTVVDVFKFVLRKQVRSISLVCGVVSLADGHGCNSVSHCAEFVKSWPVDHSVVLRRTGRVVALGGRQGLRLTPRTSATTLNIDVTAQCFMCQKLYLLRYSTWSTLIFPVLRTGRVVALRGRY